MVKENPWSCTLCHGPTWMIGTDRCSRCHELESRIKAEPALAQIILNEIDSKREEAPCISSQVYKFDSNYRLPKNYRVELWYSDGLYHWVYKGGEFYGEPLKDPIEAYHAAKKHADKRLRS